ncbi:unnamed protein product [Heligmosomoides polygyrus]|uniref:Uncharacterized protein n=1 Tax=Heligmosomoides polygyrus TaxID=6339 RepID=A0A183GQR3_HELPZ|nr:unnamed protein product [Heligmosomoides polygyrus]
MVEVLRANQSQSQPKPQCQDTDLRRIPSPASKDPAPTSDDNHGTRKSRFDQPPPELADAGFLPKPVPTASVGFVGNVPALGACSGHGSSLYASGDASVLSQKATTAPTLNPPAPLVFGDDEDDDDESEDNTRPPSIPTSAPPAVSPNIAGMQKEKAADNSKLFHILSGARYAPASPDPEGPASPDAPASPDPYERDANGSGDGLKVRSIGAVCMQ